MQLIDSRNPKVCVLGATFETSNMGVGALAAGTVRCVLHQWPDADVFFLDYGKEERTYRLTVEGRQATVPLVNIRFSKKLYLPNNIAWLITLAFLARLMPTPPLRKQIVESNRWLKRVDDANLVLSIAGGDSFSDIYGLRRLAYVTLAPILALLLGKDVVLMPQTLGPFKSRVAKLVARYIIGHAKVVYSRDRKGLDETIAELGLDSNSTKYRFSYDVGFVLDPVPPVKLDIVGLAAENGRCRVGLNVSGLLWMGGYTGKNMFGLRADYRKLIYVLIERLIADRQCEVILVPHVFGSDSESDTTVCAALYEELSKKYPGKLGIAQGHYDQGEIKSVIGACDFFVGSRMHACIAALSQCVPAVAVAYSDKFIGVLKTIGMEGAVADPRYLDETAIVNFVDLKFEERQAAHQQLAMVMPGVRESVLGLFADSKIDAGERLVLADATP